jgi:hypothetical protein
MLQLKKWNKQSKLKSCVEKNFGNRGKGIDLKAI